MIATTLPIKLSDVCLEIYGSSSTSGKSLSGCIAAATGTWNPTYEDNKDSLIDFRGYNHGGGGQTLYPLSLYVFPFTIAVREPCGLTLSSMTIYSTHPTMALTYANSGTLYSDSAGNSVLGDYVISEDIALSEYWYWVGGAFVNNGTCP